MVMFQNRPSRDFPSVESFDDGASSESPQMLGFRFREGFLGACVGGASLGVGLGLLLDFSGP